MLTEEKRIHRFYFVLAGAALCSVLLTWLIVTLTQPALPDSAIQVWTVTQTPVQYRDKININQATMEELTYAEGIGKTTAQNIYDYLQKNGPITQIEDLEAVNGVGEKRLEALQKIFYAG